MVICQLLIHEAHVVPEVQFAGRDPCGRQIWRQVRREVITFSPAGPAAGSLSAVRHLTEPCAGNLVVCII